MTKSALVAHVRFVALVADVADQVGPGDAVGASYQPWVGYWSEGFADVGGVGDVALRGEHDGAEPVRIGGVAVACVCSICGSVVNYVSGSS